MERVLHARLAFGFIENPGLPLRRVHVHRAEAQTRNLEASAAAAERTAEAENAVPAAQYRIPCAEARAAQTTIAAGEAGRGVRVLSDWTFVLSVRIAGVLTPRPMGSGELLPIRAGNGALPHRLRHDACGQAIWMPAEVEKQQA